MIHCRLGNCKSQLPNNSSWIRHLQGAHLDRLTLIDYGALETVESIFACIRSGYFARADNLSTTMKNHQELRQSGEVTGITDAGVATDTRPTTTMKGNNQQLSKSATVPRTRDTGADKTALSHPMHHTPHEIPREAVSVRPQHSSNRLQQLLSNVLKWIGHMVTASLLRARNTGLERQLAEALRDKERAIQERDRLKEQLPHAREEYRRVSEIAAKARAQGAQAMWKQVFAPGEGFL
ncbi:MAG: hypothetical protein Q9196_000300 [Gyalolechia fulgens]